MAADPKHPSGWAGVDVGWVIVGTIISGMATVGLIGFGLDRLVGTNNVLAGIGIVVGAGEIFGGGIAPAIAGFVAKHYGIQYILYLCLAGVTLGILVSLFLKETAPKKIHRRMDKPVRAVA